MRILIQKFPKRKLLLIHFYSNKLKADRVQMALSAFDFHKYTQQKVVLGYDGRTDWTDFLEQCTDFKQKIKKNPSVSAQSVLPSYPKITFC